MFTKVLKLAALSAVMASSASMAMAQVGSRADAKGDFYATPIQKSAPRDLPGEQLVPGAPLIVNVIDGVTRPIIVDPIQNAGAGLALPVLPIVGDAAPAPAPAAAPMRRGHRMMHHRSKHHMMRHHMSKHHMMKKKMM